MNILKLSKIVNNYYKLVKIAIEQIEFAKTQGEALKIIKDSLPADSEFIKEKSDDKIFNSLKNDKSFIKAIILKNHPDKFNEGERPAQEAKFKKIFDALEKLKNVEVYEPKTFFGKRRANNPNSPLLKQRSLNQGSLKILERRVEDVAFLIRYRLSMSMSLSPSPSLNPKPRQNLILNPSHHLSQKEELFLTH